MPAITLNPINKAAQAVFTAIVEGLLPGQSRKLDNAPGTYMPLSVERLSENTFSLTHYYEQNGDLVPDPDMLFWRSSDGRFFPCHFQNALAFVRSVELRNDVPVRFARSTQHDQATFAGKWLANIALQQNVVRGMFASKEAA